MQSTLITNPITQKHVTSQISGMAYLWLSHSVRPETTPSRLGAMCLKAVHQGPECGARSPIARAQGSSTKKENVRRAFLTNTPNVHL